jgi:cytoskeletal protein CcmA (bactofilin family)
MTLVAAGLLTDGDNASTTATNLLSVTGSLISLGGSATDTVSASQLTFNSTLNTDIELDSSVELFGASNSADQLFLSSTGDISDAATADTLVENGIVLNGVNIELGELSDDCFDIVSGDINDLVVNASGTNSVILGC